MTGSGEWKTAPKGANHDEISPFEGLPRRKDEPDRVFSPAKIIKGHNPGPSHPNGYGPLPEFRVVAINRAYICYPEA